MKKIIVAVTGASGAIYARKIVERLVQVDELEHIALIFSRNGQAVARYEGETVPTDDPRVEIFDNDDMFAAPASGTADYEAMIVVPCSMGCAGRIAGGISGDLISRAADVMLKERGRLILVVRETPLSTIHLRNLTALSECGAVILPASPSFYSHACNIEELCDTVAERIMKAAGLPGDRYRWNGGDTNGR